MSQKLYVDLQFRADTDKAKKQIQSLQTTINQAISSSMQGRDLGLTPQLEKARMDAMQLKSALDKAMNVDTGKLNLNKFAMQMKTSGLSMQQLAKSMKSLGPEGQKAFSQMTDALMSAETKVFSIANGMQRLLSTFMNTIRYQVSASAIQGVTKAISQAIGYTKELDKNLTNVRIVTNKSAGEMKNFATQANAAAKSLSVSTNEYIKASHIYFQQGLDTAEAMKRAESTIKLAHATGESMEEVSNWMTAIWNNFDDGSKSLEYYGDVLAKLGAETASSADEIAQGLEKFAAVADTVGLSYEYAASALATVTAETRQSADVVGTAFKTLFARMEGLKLGETLDDGTTLNQYSLALETVGVDIKTVNGEMKDMDTILDETALKWNTLSKDQQIALAQSVAGVRQYTQFIALMDNYDVMQNNLESTRAAAGELENMQGIYEESIEGLKEKFGTAKEELISSLVDEDSIKNFYKAMNGIMNFAGKLTKAFGGLEGILLMAASALTKMYQPKIATMFTNMAVSANDVKIHTQNMGTRFMNTFRSPEKKKELLATTGEQMRNEALEQSRQIEASQAGGISSVQITNKIYDIKKKLSAEDKILTQQQKDQLNWQIQILEATKQTLIEEEKRIDALRELSVEKAESVNKGTDKESLDRKKSAITTLSEKGQAAADMTYNPKVQTQADVGARMVGQLKEAQKAAQDLGIDISKFGFEEAIGEAQRFSESIEGTAEEFDLVKSKVDELNQKIQNAAAYQKASLITADLVVDTKNLQDRGENLGRMEARVDETVHIAKTVDKDSIKTDEQSKKNFSEQLTNSLNDTKDMAQKLGMNVKDLGFEDALADVERFADGAEIQIEDLIRKLEAFQNKVKNGISSDIVQTTTDTAVDTVAGKEGVSQDLRGIGSGEKEQVEKGVQGLKDKGVGDPAKIKEIEKGYKKLNKIKANNTKLEAEAQAKKKSGQKLNAQEEKALKKSRGALTAATKAYQKNVNSLKQGIAPQKKVTDLLLQRGEAMVDTANSSKDLGKKEEELAIKTKKTTDAVKRQYETIVNSANFFEKFGKGMSSTLSGAMQLVSGFNMLTNGVTTLSSAIRSGSKDWGDYLTAAMAILPGLMQLIGPTTKVISTLLLKAAAKQKARIEDKKAADEAPVNAAKEKAADDTKKKSKISLAITRVVEWFTKGPGGWVIGAVGVAALAAVGIGLAIKKGNEKAANEETKEEIDKGNEVVSASQEVSKNFTSLTEQVDTFKNLRESGESTVNVLKDMASTVNSIGTEIDKLLEKDLDKEDGWGFLGTIKSELKAAQEDLEKGIITIEQYETIVKEKQAQLSKAQITTATDTFKEAVDLANQTGAQEDKDKAKETQNTLMSQINTTLETDEASLNKAVDKFVAGEPYGTAEDAQKAWANAAIKAIMGEDYSLTDMYDQETAKINLLNSAPMRVHRVINGLKSLAMHGAIYNKYGSGMASHVKQWVADTGSYKYAYLNQIDLDKPQSTWDKQIQEVIEQENYARQKKKAEDKYKVSEDSFDNYTEAIMENNTALKDNEDLAGQVALQTVQISTGLTPLMEKYAEYSDLLAQGVKDQKEGKKASLAYYKALDELSLLMKDTFGFEVSDDFVEKNLSLIEAVSLGSVEALDELRSKLAEEFIITYKFKEVEGGLSADDQKTLLESIASDLELNPDVDLSRYYDSLNTMIKYGQIKVEELQTFFAANGKAFTLADKIEDKDGNWIEGFGKHTEFTEGPDSADLFQGGKPKEHKELDEEIERYHEIKEILDDIGNELDRINKAKDRAFGPKKIALIQMERKTLEADVDAQKQYTKELEENVDKDWDALSKYGASRDEQGRITNYEELYQAQLNELNRIYDTGNEVLIEKADEAYAEFVKEFEQYEESLNEFEQAQADLVTKENALFDNSLEEVSETLNYELSLVEDKMAVLEYQLENLDDPIYDAAKAMQVLGEQTAGTISKIESTQKALEGVLKASGLSMEDFLAGNYGDTELTAEQVDSLREYRDSLLEANTELSQMGNTVMEKVTTAIDTMNEKMAKHGEIIEHNNSLLESYKNIIDLVGKDNLGVSDQMIQELRKAQVEGSISAVKASKATLDMNKKALADTEAEFASIQDNLSEEDKKRWEETIDTMKEKVREGESELQASFETSLQTAADAFAGAVEDATNALKDAMAGIAGSADDMARSFEQQKEITGRFLEDYEKAYQLSKLNRDITNSIDTTDSIKGKRELYKLQQELLALQEDGVQVTHYESDELRARYELRLAEIALEEAQNAKSQVRMRRDSEGNWSYVYTADQANVDKAQQNYEDKLYAYEKLTHDYVKEIEGVLMEIPNEMSEALAGLNQNDEDYLEKANEIREYYADKYEYFTSRINRGLKDSKHVFEDTLYSQVSGFQTAEKALEVFASNSQNCLEELSASYTTWQQQISLAFETAGKSADTFANDMAKHLETIRKDNNTTAQNAEDMAEDFDNSFRAIIESVESWFKQYSLAIADYTNQNNELASSINGIISGYKNLATQADVNIKKYKEINAEATAAYNAQKKIDDYNDSKGKYYGYYYINGEKMRTMDAYDTVEEADYQARVERSEIAQRIINEQKYKKSQGQNVTVQSASEIYARDKQGKVIEQSSGAMEKDEAKNYIAGKSIKIGNDSPDIITRTLLNAKTGKYETVYFSKDTNFYYAKSNLYGENGPEVEIQIGDKTYRASFAMYDNIVDNIDSADPPYEAGDMVMPTENAWYYGKGHMIGGDTATVLSDITIGTNDDNTSNLNAESQSSLLKTIPTQDLWGATVKGVREQYGGWEIDSNGNQYYSPDNLRTYLKIRTNKGEECFIDQRDMQPYYYTADSVVSYDTGGYTGEWDSSGRLAMLHQKEIVLNAHDTENFLAAVNIVRDLADIIDLRAAAQYSALQAMTSSALVSTMAQTLQQDVTIHAEFPNVRERTEIEAAFDNLINRASQFANRKN